MSTFFNTVHLLPKDLSFEHGGAKVASCPGHHLTSLCPWQSTALFHVIRTQGRNQGGAIAP